MLGEINNEHYANVIFHGGAFGTLLWDDVKEKLGIVLLTHATCRCCRIMGWRYKYYQKNMAARQHINNHTPLLLAPPAKIPSHRTKTMQSVSSELSIL